MCYCNWFQSVRPRQHKSELPALEQLHAMGYEYKSQADLNKERRDYREVLLYNRIEAALRKLNPDFYDDGIYDALNQINESSFPYTLDVIDTSEKVRAKLVVARVIYNSWQYTCDQGHSLGISDSYYRATEPVLLEDFLKVQDYLIINDENRLRKKVTDLTQKEQNNQYLIDEKLMKKEREIQYLREKDVINEEAIASLSDQIVKVMEEIKILKMKPLSYSKSVIIQLLLKNTWDNISTIFSNFLPNLFSFISFCIVGFFFAHTFLYKIFCIFFKSII